MKIEYASKKLEKLCTVYSHALKKLNRERAVVLYTRLRQLKSADTVEDLIREHVGRCHRLIGNLDGKYAMDLGQPWRLIFSVRIDPDSLEIVIVVDIKDYHKK